MLEISAHSARSRLISGREGAGTYARPEASELLEIGLGLFGREQLQIQNRTVKMKQD